MRASESSGNTSSRLCTHIQQDIKKKHVTRSACHQTLQSLPAQLQRLGFATSTGKLRKVIMSKHPSSVTKNKTCCTLRASFYPASAATPPAMRGQLAATSW
eukprot:1267771-Amphidinium_carterae.1